MPYASHKEANEALKAKVLEGIGEHFPIKGKKRELHLEKLEADIGTDPDDIRKQHDHKIKGKTFATPVYATLRLENKETGETSKERVRIASIPTVTSRFSHIIDGKEYQVDSQWQLKPGAYTRRDVKGKVHTAFNAPDGRDFKIELDPASKQLSLRRKKSNIPLYPLMREMGVTDEQLQKSWGKEMLEANKSARAVEGALEAFYKADKKSAAPSKKEAAAYFKEAMTATKMQPEVAKSTLGVESDHITGDVLRKATKRILDVHSGAPEDDRDSLEYKNLRSVEDFAYDKLTHWKTKKIVETRGKRQIDNPKADIRKIVNFDSFNEPVRQVFRTSMARMADQINPVEIISSASQTTPLGPGGIQSVQRVTEDAKAINPSHLGYLDPLRTPEGEKTGITLRLPMGVRKKGNEPVVPMYNVKTGKMEDVPPSKFVNANVALADQVTWDKGKPKPVGKEIKIAGKGNKLTTGSLDNVDYIQRHASQALNTTTNLVPFIGSCSGNRATYAGQHIEQSISLEHREAPLVQVGTGSKKEGLQTFEELLGKASGHMSPVDGEVVSVKGDAIVVKDKSGKKHEVQLYNNFPLNDPKAVITSTPLVKVGDSVKRRQSVADTNFTKDGKLALGTNLRAAYLPYKGYNFEDGVVVSESAAKKLSSVHMQKLPIALEDQVVTDPKKFRNQHPEAFGKEQHGKLDEKGVVKVGQTVRPGDPLVLAMRPYKMKDRMDLGSIGKSLSGQHTDISLRWESDHPGEVVGVHKKGKEVTVHVKTVEPMKAGDKLTGRHGNKGIVTCFSNDSEVLTDKGWRFFKDLDRTELICTLNPATRKIEYQAPTGYVDQQHDGKMYSYSGRRLNLLVTPEHRHYVRTRRGSYSLQPAKECFGMPRLHLRTGVWEGEELEEITIPGRPDAPKRHKKLSAPRKYDTDLFLELFGLWLTEGCIGGSSHIHIAQTRSVHPEEYERICSVIERLGYSTYKEATRITFSDPQLHAWLKQFGKAKDKFIPRELLVLSQRQLRILADALFMGDGGVYYRAKDNHTRYELFTSSPRLADDYQELALKLGFSANIKEPKPGELVVRWSLKDEVWTNNDKRYCNERWEEYKGRVYCVDVPNHIIYVRRLGIPVWSGNCVLPDKEMPHTRDGKPIDVALNPAGVPGRMNPSQILETAAGKVAEKTGKPFIVENFAPGADNLAMVKKALKEHGIEDKEELIDPVTKQSLGKVLVGPQHMLKLTHQIDKKTAVRSGMPLKGDNEPESYDNNLLPIGGKKTGGQRMSPLGIYSLLAHGAKANIREMQTIKSEGDDPRPFGWAGQHREVWSAIQSGTPLPTPRPTFSFNKFTSMLKAAGVNVEKKGHNIQLLPLTNKQIKDMSSGAIPKPAELVYTKLDKNGEPVPKRGGLFDPKITGGHGGKRWNHIKLAEPVPNPVFETAIQKLTGLKEKDYTGIVGGDQAVDEKGNIVALDTPGALTGGPGIKRLLDKIDVNKELATQQKKLKEMPVPKGMAHGAPTQEMDSTVKKIKYLRALKQIGAKPSEAYVLENLPVIPPQMRPASVMKDGSIKWEDINGLYQLLAQGNDSLKKDSMKEILDKNTAKRKARKSLYDGVKAVMGVGTFGEDDKYKGILQQIHGSSPKEGFFQKTLMNRRQDLSMRSVIVPEPSLGVDEVGMPKDYALKLMRPFVARKLVETGAARNPLEARSMLADKKATKNPSVLRAIELVADERPVILKRDPVLHKHSVQAFKTKLVGGKAIKIHPLVTGGFNADFDGDTMSAYVPVGREAVEEAKGMLPSKNLYAEASGKVTYQPSLDSAMGLYKMTKVDKVSRKSYKSPTEALQAAQRGELGMTELATVGGKKTTPGRMLVASALPDGMQEKAIESLPTLDKKGITKLYSELAKNHKGDFGDSAHKLMKFGFEAANGLVSVPNPAQKGRQAIEDAERPDKTKMYIPMGAHSLGLEDLEPDKATRDKHLGMAKKRVDLIRASKMSEAEKERQIPLVWAKASAEMDKEHRSKLPKNNLATMLSSGNKPGWDQYKQLALAPVMMVDSTGSPVPVPVDKSYAEGMDFGGYWTAATGARRGSVRKVQEVSEPGYFSKKLVQNTVNLVVTGDDCKTDRGVSMSVGDEGAYDRTLARSFKAKGLEVPAGTVLTPDILGKMRRADKNAQLVVRSALKCTHGQGLCQKCAGLGADGNRYPVGTNVGILAAQSLGERSVQLPMKAFHSGGVWTPKASVADQFARVQQLTSMPDKIANSATLAMTSGRVEKIQRDKTGTKVWVGGKAHHVGKDKKGRSLFSVDDDSPWRPPKVGDKIEAGTSLSDPSRTVVNPKDLYKATNNFEKVQNHLVDELHKIYAEEGVRRQHVETVVKGMTNTTKIRDPGDAPYLLKGEIMPASVIREQNMKLVKAGKKPTVHSPILKGVDFAPLQAQQDWMAKLQHERLRSTIMDSAATGAVSHIHGVHPVPGIAYGAEFGVTKEHAKRTPGLTRLLDVPEHAY